MRLTRQILYWTIFINFCISTFAIACPEGWSEATLNKQSYCIEITKVENIKSHEASLICEAKEAKVCTSEQWMSACRAGLISTGSWEWSISIGQYISIVGNNDCNDLAFGELSPVANLRCCK